MQNKLKFKTFKGKKPEQRYAVIQHNRVVQYFSNRDQCKNLLAHLKRGGGFSEYDIPRFMMHN